MTNERSDSRPHVPARVANYKRTGEARGRLNPRMRKNRHILTRTWSANRRADKNRPRAARIVRAGSRTHFINDFIVRFNDSIDRFSDSIDRSNDPIDR